MDELAKNGSTNADSMDDAKSYYPDLSEMLK